MEYLQIAMYVLLSLIIGAGIGMSIMHKCISALIDYEEMSIWYIKMLKKKLEFLTLEVDSAKINKVLTNEPKSVLNRNN